ncbi:MAG: IS110 family transposase [Parachlamydiaceae bacterium]|nr:MAG: IS110 family transposase [Parachlamydiaceae bacterium]
MEIRSVLHMRQTLVEEKTHVVNSLKGHLKVYGIKLTKKAGKNFRLQVEEAVKELSPKVQRVIKSLLNVMDSLNTEIKALDKEIEELAKNDEDVQLLQTIDGVGPITALSFKAEIDDIRRFKDSRNVAAYLGLTPSQYSSGETKSREESRKRIKANALLTCGSSNSPINTL